MSSPLQFSLELFPPRTPESVVKLPATLEQLAALRPDYFSITHGAGGSNQEGTYETLLTVVKHTGVEAAPHLTCAGSTREHIAAQLDRYRANGVKRIVALRGDPPATALSSAAPGEFHYAKRIVALRGDLPATALSPSAPGEFHHANQLVSFIRQTHGDAFRIEVAAYPETHPQAASPGVDFENFRRKVEAGADAAITQLFYNAESYFDFMERCAKAGITIPIVPGIMPITSFASMVRFAGGCGADLPRWIKLRLEELQFDKAALVDFGLDVVTRLCETLLKNGAPGLHFYTINQAEPTLRIWERLGLTVHS